jgi:oligosaccharide repeat unit polymerase
MATALGVLTDSRMVHVTLPLAVGLIGFTAFFWTLWRRGHGGIPWFEIGAVYVTVVTLYMVYPLIGFLVLGGIYTPLSDLRLRSLPPDAQEAGAIGWLYVSHLLGFALMYLVVRGRLPRVQPRPRPPSLRIVLGLLITSLLIDGFEVAVGLFYNTSARSYAESYLISQRLPLLMAQLSNHLDGMKYPLSVALLAVLFTQYRTGRPIIVAWLLAAAMLSLARMGSRTEVVLLLFSAAAMYHTLVRPVSVRFIAIGAALGLVGFVAFGVLRSGTSALPGYSIFNPFAAATEFEILFANAIDIGRISRTTDHFPNALYFADLGALVPQQAAPFTKIDPAAWYVARYFPPYAASGGGLAFGTISEAILTGGWVSALLRGATLGLCFATIHRAYIRRSRSFWALVFYIWISTLAYHSFRNTTFSLGVLAAYRFLPTVVIVTLVATILSAATRPRSPFAARPIVDGVS